MFNTHKFAVIEQMHDDRFMTSRVAMFATLDDAIDFLMDVSNPEQMQLIKLDANGQQQLADTPHVVCA